MWLRWAGIPGVSVGVSGCRGRVRAGVSGAVQAGEGGQGADRWCDGVPPGGAIGEGLPADTRLMRVIASIATYNVGYGQH